MDLSRRLSTTGEAVYPGALRELAEEAGITGYDVWAVDLTAPAAGGYQWAVFGVDVPIELEVDLVDPEHDRFAWIPADEALDLVRPTPVAVAQVQRLAGVPTVTTTYRPMTEDDLPWLVQWWRAPHAQEWFHGSEVSLAVVRERVVPRLREEIPTRIRLRSRLRAWQVVA